MELRADWWARAVGLVIGVTIAVTAISGWSVPRGSGTLGTDLIFSSAPTGELAVTPMGPFLSATGMRPGPESDAVSADLEIFNQTGKTLEVSLRGLPSDPDLDRMLMVVLEVDGAVQFRGQLVSLRSRTDPFLLASAETSIITIRAWLPRGIDPGWEGRMVQVPLEFTTVPVES